LPPTLAISSHDQGKTDPTTYKADLLAYLQNHGSEMENVREAYISTPALTQFSGSQSRYFVCRLFGTLAKDSIDRSISAASFSMGPNTSSIASDGAAASPAC
jgi:hypothetical protein